MAATASDIRAALVTALSTLSGIVPPTGYLLSEPTPPTFEIELSGIEYDRAMAQGLNEWTFTVRGFVGVASDLVAQQSLDVWMAASGTGSVKAAIESDLTLGGKVQTLHVTSVSAPRAYAVASQPNTVYLGAEWTVRIIAGA